MSWLGSILSKGLNFAGNVGKQVVSNVATNVIGNAVNSATNAATNAVTGGSGQAPAPGQSGFDWKSIIAGALPVVSALQKRDLPYQKELEGIGYSALESAKTMTPTALANMQGVIGGPAMGAIEQNLERQKSQIRQVYSQMGMSGSTAEAQDMAAAGRDAVSQQYELGRQMASVGFQGIAAQTGIADSTFSNLMQMQMQQDQELQDALAAYAALLTGAQMTGAQPGATTLQPYTPIDLNDLLTIDYPTAGPVISPNQPGLTPTYGPGGLPTSGVIPVS